MNPKAETDPRAAFSRTLIDGWDWDWDGDWDGDWDWDLPDISCPYDVRRSSLTLDPSSSAGTNTSGSSGSSSSGGSSTSSNSNSNSTTAEDREPKKQREERGPICFGIGDGICASGYRLGIEYLHVNPPSTVSVSSTVSSTSDTVSTSTNETSTNTDINKDTNTTTYLTLRSSTGHLLTRLHPTIVNLCLPPRLSYGHRARLAVITPEATYYLIGPAVSKEEALRDGVELVVGAERSGEEREESDESEESGESEESEESGAVVELRDGGKVLWTIDENGRVSTSLEARWFVSRTGTGAGTGTGTAAATEEEEGEREGEGEGEGEKKGGETSVEAPAGMPQVGQMGAEGPTSVLIREEGRTPTSASASPSPTIGAAAAAPSAPSTPSTLPTLPTLPTIAQSVAPSEQLSAMPSLAPTPTREPQDIATGINTASGSGGGASASIVHVYQPPDAFNAGPAIASSSSSSSSIDSSRTYQSTSTSPSPHDPPFGFGLNDTATFLICLVIAFFVGLTLVVLGAYTPAAVRRVKVKVHRANHLKLIREEGRDTDTDTQQCQMMEVVESGASGAAAADSEENTLPHTNTTDTCRASWKGLPKSRSRSNLFPSKSTQNDKEDDDGRSFNVHAVTSRDACSATSSLSGTSSAFSIVCSSFRSIGRKRSEVDVHRCASAACRAKCHGRDDCRVGHSNSNSNSNKKKRLEGVKEEDNIVFVKTGNSSLDELDIEQLRSWGSM